MALHLRELIADVRGMPVKLHEILQAQEVVIAKLHENAREIARTGLHMERLKAEMEDYLQEARRVHLKIIEEEERLENRVVVLGQEVEEGRGR